MDAQVLKRIFNGLGANVYNQAVSIVVQLIGVPVLLYTWGPQLYGEWLILFAIPAYLAMTDLGYSHSAGNDMAGRVGRSDHAGALIVFQTLAALVYTVTALGLVLSALVLWYVPLQSWLHFSVMDEVTTRWVLCLFAAEIFALQPNHVSHAGFRAAGDYAFHVGLESHTRLAQFAAIWIVALAGGGPISAAAVFFCIRALGTLVCALLLHQRHNWIRIRFMHAQRAELRRLFRPALANIAVPLAQALNIQGMVLVVGATLGPVAVVVFSTHRTLSRLALQLVRAVSNSAEPELAAAYGAGDKALAHSIFIHMLRAGVWLSLLATCGLFLFGSFILDAWTHGKVIMQPALFGWLLMSSLASVLWYSSLTLLTSVNRHLRAALVFIFCSAVATVIAGMSLRWTGHLAYAGVALFVMDTTMWFFTLNAAARLLQLSPMEILVRAANPFPLASLVFKKRHAY